MDFIRFLYRKQAGEIPGAKVRKIVQAMATRPAPFGYTVLNIYKFDDLKTPGR